VTTEDGTLPERRCDASTPHEEKAHVCRALENTVYVAPANVACADQGSASCIIAPDGSLLAQVPYGQVGVATADVDLSLADGLLARRRAPERNRRADPARQA
jgi:predicted amidohydrolase